MNFSMEILDYYNDNFMLLGKDNSDEIHKKGLWHQVIHCWIFDIKSNSILYQKRANNKKIYPNKLDVSVAGHCLSNEDPILTVVREAKEELNLDIKIENLNYIGVRRDASILKPNLINREFQHIFIYPIHLDLVDIIIDTEEVDSYTLIPPDTIINILLNN